MFSVSVVRRDRRTPVYNIGVTSRLTGLPVYTLRWIESHGLVSPRRTEGNQRLFSEEDLELLQRVRDLMAQHVNLPGIRIILRMKAADSPSEEPRGRRKKKGR